MKIFGEKRFDFKNITPEMRKKQGAAYSANIKSGKTKASFAGKHHTKEALEKLSVAAKGHTNGYAKTKYYSIFSPYMNEDIKVQGTYEYKYAQYLNENKINWIKKRTISLKYKLHDDDYTHTYYPDFYLPDSDEYIEIKGFFYKSEDSRVDDERKMRKVQEHNTDKKIKLIMKAELIALGIDIKSKVE